MQLAGAQRDPPVDPPEPVTGPERPDVGELDAAARAAATGSPRPGRPGAGSRPGSRTARCRQHPQRVAVQAHRAPPVAGPRRGQATFSSPSTRRPQRRGPISIVGRSSAEAGREPGGRVQRDVRRAAPSPGPRARRPRRRRSCSREVVPWPSCSQRWSSRASTPGTESGRCSSPRRRGGRTAPRGPSPPASRRRRRPRPRPPPTTSARASAGVGRQVRSSRPVSSVAGASAPGRAPRRRCSRPVVWVIQSSGRTVTRCASTARATALTSSGMT